MDIHSTLTTLIDRLDSSAISGTDVIRWGCPVPSFGDLSISRIATLGINPSNREFMDIRGNELQGSSRRFHTLRSLGLKSWSEVDARHLNLILDTCRKYFSGNPYNRWFRKLDVVISGTNNSFYDISSSACHLDLIPYATLYKWTELPGKQRSLLLDIAGDTLGLLLRNSSVQVLILNGRSVVNQFQDITGVSLEMKEMPAWSLPRRSTTNVLGVQYSGVIDSVSGYWIGHKVLVLGFNHNLQSSFGVTNEIISSIRDWIAQVSGEVLQ